MLFVRKYFLYSLIAMKEKPIENVYIELNLRNSKWQINCPYNPHANNIGTDLDRLNKSLDIRFPQIMRK